MKEFFGLVSSIFLGALVLFGISYGGFKMYEFFNPKYEQVRYDTFKNSQTYNDGMLRDLENLHMEYIKGSDEQKAGLKALVLHRFSVYPEDRLTPELRSFYFNLKRG